MNRKNKLILILTILLVLVGCSSSNSKEDVKIILLGEKHSDEIILDKELELWGELYENNGYRHLFIEVPNYTAEFINLWMKEDSDVIFNKIYDEWEGTQMKTELVKNFYKKIKTSYPETIFHGTDVGHQFNSTGERYLKYLRSNNSDESEIDRVEKVIEQGKKYYLADDNIFRENMMVENFKFAYEKVPDGKVMGIYGSFHTDENTYLDNHTANMVGQLNKLYPGKIKVLDLTKLSNSNIVRVDRIRIGEKSYNSNYYGIEDIKGFKDFSTREFWEILDSYEYISDFKGTNDILPYSNYPINVTKNQVFLVRVTKTDGSILEYFYRSNDNDWVKNKITENFLVESYEILENK